MPTAVSELWKNAYDAYARAVSLHIYSGQSPVAAIFDDGHGMSREDFVTRWLVVGTESKATDDVTDQAQRGGLKLRPRQGQKGIGRLSVAAIGSAVLVVSRKAGQPFVAGLLDWRVFENPFLLLEDIAIPVVEFATISAAAGAVGSIAGQVAKQRGARVIGIAGGAEKCRWLTEDLGFDAAIDYKNEDVGEALDRSS